MSVGRDDPTEDLKTPKVTIKPGLHDLRARAPPDSLCARQRTRHDPGLPAHLHARTGRLGGRDPLDRRQLRQRRDLLDRAKGDECYSVPLHPELKNALLWWKLAQSRDPEKHPKIAAALDDAKTAYVLLTEKGQPVAKQTIAKQIDWRAGRAGVARFKVARGKFGEKKTSVTPHVIRRSMATSMRRQGQDVFDVSALLNHKDPATTLKHYAFAGDTAKKRAVASIAI
jgi:integrase